MAKTKLKKVKEIEKGGLLDIYDMKKPQYKLVYWFMFAVLFTMSLITFLPVLWIALSSFKDVRELYAIPPTLLPESIDLSMISRVLSKVKFGQYFLNSLAIMGGNWAFCIIINGLCGYVLSRLKPVGSKVVQTLIFWSMMLPGISMGPLFMTFTDMPLIHTNLLGTYLPMWLIAGANAYDTLLFRNFFNSIPMSYIEAARIDGCTELGTFRRIIIPLSKPIIMVVTIFIVTGSWADFMWPYLVLGNTPLEPVAVLIYRINLDQNMLMNEYMMLLIISIIPMVILYSICSKYIQGGLNMSGLKG